MDNTLIALTATKYRKMITPVIINDIDRVISNIFETGFRMGAKWMEEKCYSQQDVINIIYQYELYRLECEAKNLKVTTITKWFETIREQ